MYPCLRVLLLFLHAVSVGMIFHQVPIVDAHLLVYLPEDCEVVPLGMFAALAYYSRMTDEEVVQDFFNALPLFEPPAKRIHPRNK